MQFAGQHVYAVTHQTALPRAFVQPDFGGELDVQTALDYGPAEDGQPRSPLLAEAVLALFDAGSGDDARTVVLYFLSNSATWRGPDAKRIKAELKEMLK